LNAPLAFQRAWHKVGRDQKVETHEEGLVDRDEQRQHHRRDGVGPAFAVLPRPLPAIGYGQMTDLDTGQVADSGA
jgi:hypothetical protein